MKGKRSPCCDFTIWPLLTRTAGLDIRFFHNGMKFAAKGQFFEHLLISVSVIMTLFTAAGWNVKTAVMIKAA